MQFLFIILILVFIVFLFCLYILAKEELIFVRKNVTLETIFNLAFLTAFAGLFFSRVIFVILNPSRDYFNPLVFLLFPYFPGLSLIGGIAGGLLFLVYYGRLKKLPVARLFDFFSLALLASLPFGFVGLQALVGFTDLFVGVMMPLIYGATLIFFLKVLLPLNARGEIEDGSLGFLFLMIFSFTFLLSNIVRTSSDFRFFLQVDNMLLILLFIVALALLFWQEKSIGKNKSKSIRGERKL